MILGALVQEYVRSADPVSSADLLKKYKFPFSSATIRNDFQTLTEEGYLAKPHVSAGRIPTDKAYRFYITEREKSEQGVKAPGIRTFSELVDDEMQSEEEFLRNAAAILARASRGFATAGMVDDSLFFKYGFSDVLQEPEFSDAEIARDFGRCIDEFEKSASELFKSVGQHNPEALIGKENPVKSAREYGMVVYAYSSDEGGRNRKKIISIMGPKRMDYERNIALLKEFDEVIRQLYIE